MSSLNFSRRSSLSNRTEPEIEQNIRKVKVAELELPAFQRFKTVTFKRSTTAIVELLIVPQYSANETVNQICTFENVYGCV